MEAINFTCQEELEEDGISSASHVLVRFFCFASFDRIRLMSHFRFERIVVDEYTYLGTNQIASVMALRASSRVITFFFSPPQL